MPARTHSHGQGQGQGPAAGKCFDLQFMKLTLKWCLPAAAAVDFLTETSTFQWMLHFKLISFSWLRASTTETGCSATDCYEYTMQQEWELSVNWLAFHLADTLKDLNALSRLKSLAWLIIYKDSERQRDSAREWRVGYKQGRPELWLALNWYLCLHCGHSNWCLHAAWSLV